MGKGNRRSVRVPGYDYTSPGEYFITVAAYKREMLFGEIENDEMRLNALGKIVSDCWHEIPNHFPHVDLDAFVVMPNHIHGIIVITDNIRRGTIYRAPTETTEQFGKPIPGSIPTIMRTFKAAVTRRIGRDGHESSVWQRNYSEHIIRGDRDRRRIHDYILANPENWDPDEDNPV
ncbi:MAG: transposase [Anaerolineae bacterium]|nr:transposase [Anaerolineae bacterium]